MDGSTICFTRNQSQANGKNTQESDRLGLFVVSDLWSERPYMVGVIGLSVVWLALEGRVRPWLLVPLL